MVLYGTDEPLRHDIEILDSLELDDHIYLHYDAEPQRPVLYIRRYDDGEFKAGHRVSWTPPGPSFEDYDSEYDDFDDLDDDTSGLLHLAIMMTMGLI